MATEVKPGYRIQVVLQNKANQVKNYTDSDQIIVSRVNGETLTHRLQNLEIARHNLDEVVKQLRSNVAAFDTLKADFDTVKSSAEKAVAEQERVSARFDVIQTQFEELVADFETIPIVEASSINGNIVIDGEETSVYKPDRAIMRSGTDIPEDMSEGEIFALTF